MAISMLKIRRPLGRLIFNMGIAIPGKTVFLIETAPRRTTYLHAATRAFDQKDRFLSNPFKHATAYQNLGQNQTDCRPGASFTNMDK